jgi:hypothetical protein
MNDYLSPHVLIIALTFLLAGIVKGVTGMGLATVAVGILGAIMSPVSAASLLVIPSFVTSFWQLFTGPNFLAVMERPAEAKSHLGSPDRIKRCVWVGGMVNACTGLRVHPAVRTRLRDCFSTCSAKLANTRASRIRRRGLPFNAPLEVQALFELQ